ncbi:Ribosomal RNA processing protein 1 homolog B OS=Homo sapiens GN=RRP1B PE=1 SV=3 [Rhizoctonia solani AG-1 IB]|uniref:Ribosomal RNA processing protein 1 homolog B n=1 Tax=Thanatephorus cucumeris (strain AG1-IB / isolate 7/3/14) TaxID=1108050 RepID=A0A0B7FEV1_THACB|nr:Ribosomal RNA processing protein 1 homolog B OS=Homo sapiens GN=RRP1B PE=1 SV=3 [Rhizoctonia solani AG-1 IB]
MSDSSNSTASKPEVPALGKYLASTEKKTRDKAIKSLATFLSDDSQKSMSPLERAKLWKGLFYCFWMSDKPLVQQELSSELANLALVIPSLDSAVGFIRGFWEAMVREWAGIDRYRINKYYMLIRRFVNVTFRLLLEHEWNPEACNAINDILQGSGGPLCPDDKKVPASLSYHLADIYLEELDKALDISNNDHNLPLITLLKPFINLSAYTPNKITYSRMQTALLTPLLDELIFRATSSNDETTEPQPRKRKRSSEAYPNIIESVCKHTSKAQDMPSAENPQIVAKEVLNAVFEVAGHTDTKDANRRKMYALWKQRMEEIEGPPEGDGVN